MPAPTAAHRRRPLLRRVGIALAAVVLALLGAAGAGGLWLRHQLRASLPALEGEIALAGLEAPVAIERDRFGVPAVRAASRSDAAFALGFLHAQERFFQMDLQRRRAAGELSELFGPAALPADRDARVHRFRARARRFLEAAAPEPRALIESYAAGVEAGLAALGAPPFEYLLLRADPAPWRPEDTLLTVIAMYQTLQGDQFARERGYGLMAERLPAELVAFLTPPGNEWDAPLVGPPLPAPPPPGPEVLDLRASLRRPRRPPSRSCPARRSPTADALPGSNAWAVAGTQTAAGGGGLVANDMHLDLGLPNIWYRAALTFPGRGETERRLAGVTLPGTPAVVVGSNGHVAWGFTNLQADTADLVVVEPDPSDPARYLTPDGPRAFEVTAETIAVQDGPAETFEVRETIWGPVIGEDASGRPLALAWIAHRDGAVGLELMAIEQASGLDEAIAIAVRSSIPAQNFVAADAAGRIGWTVAGRIPERLDGYDPRFPASWADGAAAGGGSCRPSGRRGSSTRPRGGSGPPTTGSATAKSSPSSATAASTTVRAPASIRDRLRALEAATPADMLAIQLDDSAFFLERWRALLVETLDREGGRSAGGDPRRREARRLLDDWTGRASIDSVAYRLVRGVRRSFAEDVFAALTAPCREADPGFDYLEVYLRWEGPLWRLVEERPPHLLDPRHASWDAALLDALDRTLDALAERGLPLAESTWGRYNTIQLRHPLSQAVPQLGRWLDLEPARSPATATRRASSDPGFGASERMAVSPGREEEGYFHMPGGQSGHPLSPHYRDGHAAWVAGEPTPFLPGPPVHILRLVPAGAPPRTPRTD